jgi:uncharacterized protein
MDHPLILFAHGAGVPSSSPWMQGWKSRLTALGDVVTFDYPYAAQGRRRPDPQAVLLKAHRAAYEAARSSHPGAPVVLAGKSMGSRLSCHLAVEVPALAVVCFGYPLVGANGNLRDTVLRQLRLPILFIQGTSDHLCPLDALEQVRAEMTAPSALYIAESGDHSLLATKTWLKAEGLDQAAVDERILEAVQRFLRSHQIST